MRDNSQLTPGHYYRITDYICTTVQEGTQSAGNQFDIIVLALDVNRLSENAFATHHEGDEYFQEVNLSAWQIKYCLDNDVINFTWVDEQNGHGVIYYLKDEWENEAPYDFKNIMFKRPITYDPSDYGSQIPLLDTSNGSEEWLYTFACHGASGGWRDASSFSLGCVSNIIKPCSANDIDSLVSYSGRFLNDIVCITYDIYNRYGVVGGHCIGNYFGQDCQSITIGNEGAYNTFVASNLNIILKESCQYNVFEQGARYTTMGNLCAANILQPWSSVTMGDDCCCNIFKQCVYITMGNGCHGNTFEIYSSATMGDGCYGSTFEPISNVTMGDDCHDNYFGANSNNTLGNSCSNNYFGTGSMSNSLGNYCIGNYFGNSSYGNILGSYCYYIHFGEGTAYANFGSQINYIRNITIAPGCSYLNIRSADTASGPQNYLQNIYIHEGVQGFSTSNRLTITVPDRNLNYSIDYYKSGSKEIYL
jgi:hypothetical protein